MGNTATTLHDDEFEEFDGVETLGYRVLGVQPDSPSSKAGLVSFFDFLVGANGQMLLGSGEGLEEGEEYDDVDFPALLQENKGKVVELLVWNIKAQEKRFVELTPNDDWDGQGLLGVTIKLDDYGGADERLLRVLEVQDGSPASVAGLMKEKDFMLGTTSVNFANTADLATLLEENIDQVVEIYVYNCDTDMVRVIALMPSYSWGGHGLLGAEVGSGYLHRLPSSCRSTIGKSVERKVRWTTKGANDDQYSQNETLEMEPHLEMEVEREEGGNQVLLETGTRQPHELGNSEAVKIFPTASATTKQQTVSSTNTLQPTLAAPTQEQLSYDHKFLPSHSSETTGSPGVMATSFSSPPVLHTPIQPSNAPFSTPFMPAPPKMTY